MFIVGIPLTQQPPGRGETSAACGMAQVPRAKGHLVVFHAGSGELGSRFFWGLRFFPLFDLDTYYLHTLYIYAYNVYIYIYTFCVYIYIYSITRIYILYTWIYIYIYTYIDHH